MERVTGQSLEIKVLVECLRRRVLGVNQECADADRFGDSERAQNGIFQQRRAQPLSLSAAING